MDNREIVLMLLYNVISTGLTFSFISLTLGRPYKSRKVVFLLCTAYYAVVSFIPLIFTQSSKPIILLLSNIAMMSLITTSFKGNFKKKALAVLISYTFLMLSEGIGNLISAFFPLDNEEILRDTIRLFLCKAIAFVILRFLLLRRNRNDFDALEIKTSVWIKAICVPLLSILFLGIYAYNITAIDESYILLVAILIAINVLFFSLYEEIARNYRSLLKLRGVEIQNVYYAEYLQDILNNQAQFRKFKHDYKNALISLESYITDGDTAKAKAYLVDLNLYLGASNSPIQSGDKDVDAILNYYYQKAQSLGIDFTWKLKVSCDIEVAPLDLNIVLGNLLDNAIDAATLFDRGQKTVNVEIKCSYSSMLITISNSAIISEERKNQIKNQNLLSTSKQDKVNHGLGINNVIHIVDKYNGEIQIDYQDTTFIVTLLLLKPFQEKNK